MTQQKCLDLGLGGAGGSEHDSANLHTRGTLAHAVCLRAYWGAGIRNWSVRPQADPPRHCLITCLQEATASWPGLQPGRTEGAATCPKPEWPRGRMAARGWLPETQVVGGGVERMSPGQPQRTWPQSWDQGGLPQHAVCSRTFHL